MRGGFLFGRKLNFGFDQCTLARGIFLQEEDDVHGYTSKRRAVHGGIAR